MFVMSYQIGRWHPVHILQHALRLHDTKSIHLLLEAGANINQYINVKSYVKVREQLMIV